MANNKSTTKKPVRRNRRPKKKNVGGRPSINARDRMVPVGVSMPADLRMILEEVVNDTGRNRSEIVVKILRPGLVRLAKSTRSL